MTYYPADGTAVSGTSTLFAINENIGIGSTSPRSKLTVNGSTTIWGSNLAVGSLNPLVTCTSCITMTGNDDSINGVTFQAENQGTGVSSYSGFNMHNNRASSLTSNYAGMYLNGSNFSTTSFGTANATPDLMQVANTMGPVSIQSGSSTNGYISFLTGGLNTTDEKMRIATSGAIGIGTTTPAYKLEVVNNTTADATMAITNFSNTGDARSVLSANTSQGSLSIYAMGPAYSPFTQFLPNSGVFRTSSGLTNGFAMGTGPAAPLSLFTNDITRLYITGAGNVGIGTTTPQTAFVVIATSTFSTTTQASSTITTLNVPGVATVRGAATFGSTVGVTGILSATSPAFTTSVTTPTVSFTAFAGATTLLTIGGTGASASLFMPSTLDTTSSITGAIRTSGGISAAKAANFGTNLTVGATSTLATSTIRGNLGIGTTSPSALFALAVVGSTTISNGLSLPGLSVSTAGNALCYLTGGVTVASGNTTCITSSQKTKHNIATLDSKLALDTIMRLRPVSYVNNEGGDARYGLIAEETNVIDPTLVETAQKDTLLPGASGLIKAGEPIAVDYQRSVMGMVLGAIQEQQKQISSMGGAAKRSVEENWQWLLIGMLFLIVSVEGYYIYKLTKK
jgi:hypothetical protein